MTQFGVTPWLSNPKFAPKPAVNNTAARVAAIQAALDDPNKPAEPSNVPPLRLPTAPLPIYPMMRIAMEVASKYELSSWRELRSRRRGKLTIPKWECWWRCRNETNHSLSSIGRFFGFDHTSIMHGISRYQAIVEGGDRPLQGTIGPTKL